MDTAVLKGLITAYQEYSHPASQPCLGAGIPFKEENIHIICVYVYLYILYISVPQPLSTMGQTILCEEGLYLLCFIRMFNSILGLNPLDASCDNQKCYQILPNAPAGQNPHLFENHFYTSKWLQEYSRCSINTF